MTTFYSQGNGAWSTLTNWDTVTTGGGSDPASVAAMDDQTFVIQAGHNIEFDVDMSGFANGIAGLTITGHASSAQGMLYCKYSAAGTYHLKLKSGASIVGTNVANKGRILANSDGVWANSTALPFDRKFIIEFAGTTACGALNCQYLEVKLYCVNPTTHRYVRVYKEKHTVTASAVNDTFTKVAHGWTNTTAVMFKSSTTIPAPLEDDTLYWIVDKTDDTFKVARVSGGTAIGLTDEGSGTIEAFIGHTDTATGALLVLEDLTSEPTWITDAGHDHVILVNIGPMASVYDFQRSTMTVIDTTDPFGVTIADNVDGALFPGARLYLVSRNISIRSSVTDSDPIVTGTTISSSLNTPPVGSVFQCEIRSTVPTGSAAGTSRLITTMNTATFSGTIASGIAALYGCNGCTMSGVMVGNNEGLSNNTSNSTVSGLVSGGAVAVAGTGTIFTGEIAGCTYAITTQQFGSIYTGTIRGCVHAFGNAIYGKGGIITSRVENCTYLYRGASNEFASLIGGRILAHQMLPYTRAVAFPTRIGIENYLSSGETKIFDGQGDIIRVAIGGADPIPSHNPSAAVSGYCIEASNIQFNCTPGFPLCFWNIGDHRIWMTAGTYTLTYPIQTTYSAIAAGGIKLSVLYPSVSSPLTHALATSATAIATRDDRADWSETLAVTITVAADGWVYPKIELMLYESGGEVYVWPVPTVS